MLFEKKLMPDAVLGSYLELTPEFLSSLGAVAVISDIDNTLAPYEELDASDEVSRWVESLRICGVPITLVSNNGKGRVSRFNRRLGLPAFHSVGKPSTKYIKRAMEEMGSTPENTVFLGDQLLTDSLAAHRAGMRAVIVPPIKDKRSILFRVKRAIERPYLKKFNKQNAK